MYGVCTPQAATRLLVPESPLDTMGAIAVLLFFLGFLLWLIWFLRRAIRIQVTWRDGVVLGLLFGGCCGRY